MTVWCSTHAGQLPFAAGDRRNIYHDRNLDDMDSKSTNYHCERRLVAPKDFQKRIAQFGYISLPVHISLSPIIFIVVHVERKITTMFVYFNLYVQRMEGSAHSFSSPQEFRCT